MRNNMQGFTLIEVLIALAILAIALIAMMKATAEDLRNMHYLQNKTLATWVGTQVMNEALVGIIKPSDTPEAVEQETIILGNSFHSTIAILDTPNAHIKQVQVDVFNQNQKKLLELVSYEYIK